MAELPGWDRARLLTAPPTDVEAARMLVFARRVAPVLEVDYPARIRELERVDRPPSKQTLFAERRAMIEKLRAAEREQAGLRAALGLDEDDV